jgi:ribosome recycling factor
LCRLKNKILEDIMNPTIGDAKQRMGKSVETFRSEVAKIRTGKATTALLDGVKVDYYGTLTPLKQAANVSVLDAHTLSITPWDKSLIGAIEKAILIADLGLNPANDGTNLKIPIPLLTEERRKEMVKMVKKMGEDSKVAIRNVRRDANEHLKKQEKDKKLSEDDLKEAENDVQKTTNDHIQMIDDVIKKKEKEIMEV